jgi:hypothetical protein
MLVGLLLWLLILSSLLIWPPPEQAENGMQFFFGADIL